MLYIVAGTATETHDAADHDARTVLGDQGRDRATPICREGWRDRWCVRLDNPTVTFRRIGRQYHGGCAMRV